MKSIILRAKTNLGYSNQQSGINSGITNLIEQNRRLEMTRSQEIQQLKHDILAAIPSVENLQKGNRKQRTKEEIDDVRKGIDEWTRRGRSLSLEQSIIASLRFDGMLHRQDDIPVAHHRTFQWIHDRGIHFKKWFEQDAGVFWISGDPGSGKSTLVKYLSHDETIDEALQRWAGDKRLITARFYFWFSGTPLQKSQEGLLRSLLYEVLRQCPSSIETACPTRWRERIDRPWSLNELMETLSLVRLNSPETRFCFFIDGLDEYSGNGENGSEGGVATHVAQIIGVMSELSKLADVKLCLSSRPWHPFEQAFGRSDDYKLYVNEENRDDIRLYINDRFEKAEVFINSRTSADSLQQLVNDIVEDSRGVFLWVVLVIERLLRGLTNQDRLAELRKRLEATPKTLNEIFDRMLASVEDVYHEQAAQILMVALHAVEPMPVVVYSYIGDDDHDALANQIAPWSAQECVDIAEASLVRLRVRCPDLIKIRISHKDPRTAQALGHHQVDFLHRTVRDYLALDDTQKQLKARLQKPFEPSQFLCHALLAHLKGFTAHGLYGNLMEDPLGVWNKVHCILHHAKDLEVKTCTAQTALLDELNLVMSTHMKRNNFVVHGNSFMNLMVQYNLRLYVEQKIPQGLSASWVSLLRRALMLDPEPSLPLRHLPPSAAMVSLLLEHGANPNEIAAGNTTVWHFFMRSLYAQHTAQRNNHSPHQSERHRENLIIVQELLKQGADPNLRCTISMGSPKPTVGRAKGIGYPQTMGLSDILGVMYSREECAYVHAIIRERRTGFLTPLWNMMGWT